MSKQNFIALCMAGMTTIDQIDQFVSLWHRNKAGQGQELHAFLGMNEQEYAAWMQDPAALVRIIANRKATAA